MNKSDHFDELRRMAFNRGAADYVRAKQQRIGSEPLWKNNPHQNNHATDEAQAWNEGWELAEQEDADALREHREDGPKDVPEGY